MADQDKRRDNPRKRHGQDRAPTTGAKARRLVAANVVVASVLVVALMVAANYITDWLGKKYDLKADLTEGRRYSFSERTRKTLDKFDSRIRLTSLFVAGEKDEQAELRKRGVEDLLREYENASGNVVAEFIDPAEDAAKLQDLARRIAALHADETVPYVEAVRTSLGFLRELARFLKGEQQLFEEAARKNDLSPGVKTFVTQVSYALTSQADAVTRLIESLEKEFAAQLSGEGGEALKPKAGELGLPGYSDAVSRVVVTLNGTANVFNQIVQGANHWLQVEGVKLPEDTRGTLAGAEDRYRDIQQKMVDVMKPAADLKPLELEKTLGELGLNTVVIEAAGQVRVVGMDDIWPVVPGEERYDPTARRAFNGEDVITSALLGMAMKQKPEAVFVTWGGGMVSEDFGNYTEVASRLKHSNFQIRSWDLMNQGEMPELENPEQAVLVLMPPEPPRNMGMMQMPPPPPTPTSYDPVRSFIDKGGSALLLARPRAGMSPAAPYLAIAEDFGVRVEEEAVVIQSIEMVGGQKQPVAQFELSDYPSPGKAASAHPIVAPLEGMRSRFMAPAVVKVADTLPEGVVVRPLATIVEKTGPVWGEKDLMLLVNKGEAEFDVGVDVAPPFQAALAATRVARPATEETPTDESGAAEQKADAAPAGKAAETRLVLIAADSLIANRDGRGGALAQADLMLAPNGRVVYDYPYPANAELFVNSMLWLAGLEDMIAVSPKAHEPRRIGHLEPTPQAIIRWIIWAGLPVLVMALGVVVCVVRSRVR